MAPAPQEFQRKPEDTARDLVGELYAQHIAENGLADTVQPLENKLRYGGKTKDQQDRQEPVVSMGLDDVIDEYLAGCRRACCKNPGR